MRLYAKAKDEGLDLIEIAPNARSTCLQNNGYGQVSSMMQQKKANKAKKKHKKVELKEIKLKTCNRNS